MTKDDRLFAPFPIEMDEHPKIIGLSDAAFRAIFEATFYSRRMLSDGFLDERVVLKRWGQQVAEELSANDPERPSWIRVEHGWRIHDFEKHHPLRAEIEEKRRKVSADRSQAGAKGAAKRWQGDSKTMANDSSETETETETETRKKNSPSEVADATTRPEIIHLLDLLDAEIERNGAKKPTRTKKNIDAARLLLDRDGKTVEQVAAAIRWAQGNEFWRSNILSMSKLRDKYDTLQLAAKKTTPGSVPSAPPKKRFVAGVYENED